MPSLEDLTTDQLLARARETEASAGLLNALLGNPATRETMQRALKTIKPELVIPEIDTADRVRKEIAASDERVSKLENQILERDVRERIERQRAAIKDKYRLTDDDITEVEKVMIDKENPIPSYDAAARVYLASRTPSTPTPAVYNAPTYEMPEKDIWAGGIGNKAKLDKIAMNQAFEAFNDIMKAKVPGLGPAARA